jgi:hypothetical protein
MKYEVEVRSRPKKADPISEKHARFFAELSSIDSPWGIRGADIPTPPKDRGFEEDTYLTFSKLLGKGISGREYFNSRAYLEDEAMNDDFFDMSFNPEKVDYRHLVQEVLPKLISAFDGYFAKLGDARFVTIDFDAEEEAGASDCRFDIYRIYPISFFDRILCKRAFHLNPEQIVSRLARHVENVTLLGDGVYIVGSSEPLQLDDANKLCWTMKKLVSDKRPAK